MICKDIFERPASLGVRGLDIGKSIWYKGGEGRGQLMNQKDQDYREITHRRIKRVMKIFALDGKVRIIGGKVFVKITGHCYLCNERRKLHKDTFRQLVFRLENLINDTSYYSMMLEVFGHHQQKLS